MVPKVTQFMDARSSNLLQKDGATEHPPPYERATTLGSTRLGGNRAIRVAMLLEFNPSTGFEYLTPYLETFHDHFLVRGPSSPSATPIRVYRVLKSLKNTIVARFKYMDDTRDAMPRSPLDVIGIGEIERSFRLGRVYEWTRDWDFNLSVQNHPNTGEKWMTNGCVYFRGLSPYECIVPWNDPSRTQRVEGGLLPAKYEAEGLKYKWMEFTWKFCERSDNPRWGGSFSLYYQQGGALASGTSIYGVVTGLEDPWVFFSPALTTK